MNVLNEARALLESEGYRTSADSDSSRQFIFEDNSVLGCVTAYATPIDLLDRWELSQDNFLKRHAGMFRLYPGKAWNIYTVHLSTDAAPASVASRLLDVEEDLRGTRKLVATGVNTKDAVHNSLLPLLKIRQTALLKDTDVERELNERLAAIHPCFRGLISTSARDLSTILTAAEERR